MSYDFHIAMDTGGPEPHLIAWVSKDRLAGVEGEPLPEHSFRCGNYTSNVTPIWERCLTAAGGLLGWMEWFEGADPGRIQLRDLHGQPCVELELLLSEAVAYGIEHIYELRKLNPENGWGSADGAITYLWDIQRACAEHPKGKLWLSH